MSLVDYPEAPPFEEQTGRVFDWQNEAPELAVTPDEITPNFWQKSLWRPRIAGALAMLASYYMLMGIEYSASANEDIQNGMIDTAEYVLHTTSRVGGAVLFGLGFAVTILSFSKSVDRANSDYVEEH